MLSRFNTQTVWRTCSPGLEAVVLRSRNEGGHAVSYTDYSLSHVQVELMNMTEGVASGVVNSRMRRRHFSIFQDDLDFAGAPEPKVGDLIRQTEDGGSEWLVQDVPHGLLGNEFCCTCQEYID